MEPPKILTLAFRDKMRVTLDIEDTTRAIDVAKKKHEKLLREANEAEEALKELKIKQVVAHRMNEEIKRQMSSHFDVMPPNEQRAFRCLEDAIDSKDDREVLDLLHKFVLVQRENAGPEDSVFNGYHSNRPSEGLLFVAQKNSHLSAELLDPDFVMNCEAL